MGGYEVNGKTTPCEVEKPNGDRYPSEFYGIFQYSDSDGSRPVAVVRLMDGRLGMVHPSSVRMRPAEYFHRKDGTRVYVEK